MTEPTELPFFNFLPLQDLESDKTSQVNDYFRQLDDSLRWLFEHTFAGGELGGGGGLLSAEYRFSSDTAAADPGSGRYRFDTGSYATVTEIFIDDDTDNGVDISNLLALVGLGDRLYFQVKTEANKFRKFRIR